jgi:hypothetical protein
MRHTSRWLTPACLCWRPAENHILADSAKKNAAESGFIDMEQIPFDYCPPQQRRILTTEQAGHTVKEMINIPDIRFPLANRSLT